MRQCRYYKGYGYISGDGIIDTLTNVLSSSRTKDILTEGAKALAKSAGDKAGAKLVEKITSKSSTSKTKSQPRNSEDLLKQIYGNSIIGKGIKKTL